MTDTPQHQGDIFTDPRFIRQLKTAVVVMALILILGFIAIIARIFYLSSRTPTQPAAGQQAAVAAPGAASAPAGAAAALAARARLDLPPGAAVRAVSLSGSRLAVHHESPAGTAIDILDLETGRTLSRVEIGTTAPR